MVANGLKGAFTQGTVSPAGGLVPKCTQQRQRRCKLAQGPNLLCAACQCKDACWNQLDPINGAVRQHSTTLHCTKTAPCVKVPKGYEPQKFDKNESRHFACGKRVKVVHVLGVLQWRIWPLCPGPLPLSLCPGMEWNKVNTWDLDSLAPGRPTVKPLV